MHQSKQGLKEGSSGKKQIVVHRTQITTNTKTQETGERQQHIMFGSPKKNFLLSSIVSLMLATSTSAFVVNTPSTLIGSRISSTTAKSAFRTATIWKIQSSATDDDAAAAPPPAAKEEEEELDMDYESPEDAVIQIQPKAMNRLRELKVKEKKDSLVLRMGVRNGGCSGLSYVMDFSTEDDIQDDDEVDEYPDESIKCVVDAKSMLYLYGLQLDYSDELIGGGFKFFNPNAEESCGCGSSFGV